MFKRNWFLMIFSIALLLVVTACSDDSSGSESDSSDGTEENATNNGAGEGSSDEVYTIRVAMAVPETHASSIAMNEVKDSITEKSDGRIVIELYDNAQLYPSDREAVEATQIGNIESTAIATPTVATFHERFSIFDMPFLFNDRQAAYRAMDGDLGNTLNEELEEVGLVSLGYGENGFRHILNSKHPVEKPEDMEGFKFRVMENKVYEEMFNELGANSSPLAFGELYTALQQGVYDGMDNPISLVYTMKFYEVQDYLTLSSHTFAPIITVINKDYYDSMPEDLQQILQEGMDEFHQRQRQITAEQDDEYIKTLEEEMEINELTPEQKELFINKLEPIYEKYKDVVGEDLMEMARQANE